MPRNQNNEGSPGSVEMREMCRLSAGSGVLRGGELLKLIKNFYIAAQMAQS